MQARTLLLSLALLALPTAGCIENMRDLKDRLGGGEDEPVQPAAVDEEVPDAPAPNATKVRKAPVARMEVYAAGGALVYKSSFLGDNASAPVARPAKEGLTLSAGESEALEPGATLVAFAWTFAGATVGGRQATVAMPEAPGAYPLVFTVTDSHGLTDAQSLVLAVAPQPFDVVLDLQTTTVAGATVEGEQHGETGTAAFDVVSEIDGKPVKATAAKVVASPDLHCDVALEVLGPDGASLGRVDDNGVSTADETETISLTAPAAGAYAVEASPFHCVAQEGVPVTVTVTYVEVVTGLPDDGHGAH